MNNDAGHAAHFLRRIDRLSADHADLALGLYNDDELVRYLLSSTLLPKEADRVAIALDDEGQGPFVIVTRAGKFVTCLGKGMRLSPGQVVFSRRSLDKTSERITDLRELFVKAQERGRHSMQRLIGRVVTAGPALSREEFDDLLTWMPITRDVYLETLVQTIGMLTPLYSRLERLKSFGKRHEEVLRAYWQGTWAVSHLTLLMAEEPALLPAMFEVGERQGNGPYSFRRYFMYDLFRTWMLPQALRAAWLPARLAKWFLPALKEFWKQQPIGDERLFLGMGLLAVGCRHQKQRARIEKLLARTGEHEREAIAKFDRWLSSRLLDVMTYADEDKAASAVGERLLQLSRDEPGDGGLGPVLEQMPPELHATLAANMVFPLLDEHGSIELVLELLPQVARFEARDFYLPERYCSSLHERYPKDLAIEYVKMRAAYDYRRKRKPYVAPPTPGRNEPCSCGSGKKYKRCCGMN